VNIANLRSRSIGCVTLCSTQMRSALLAVSLATALSGCSFFVRPTQSRAAPILDAMLDAHESIAYLELTRR